jgi:N-acetylmuramoyl-L-alanine amidase
LAERYNSGERPRSKPHLQQNCQEEHSNIVPCAGKSIPTGLTSALPFLEGLPASGAITEDQSVLLQRIADVAWLRTGGSGAAIALGDPSSMVCVVASGAIAPPPGSPINSEKGLAAECIRTGEAVKCSDARSDTRVNPEACEAMGISCILYVPILGGKREVIGLLGVFSSKPFHFLETDLARLKELVGSKQASALARNSKAGETVTPQFRQFSFRNRIPIFMAAVVGMVITAGWMNYHNGGRVQAKNAMAPPQVSAAVLPMQRPVAMAPRIMVVIDPGHGGRDVGTSSLTGLREKDLTLFIAERLGSLLKERLGIDVVLTRTDDSYVPLETRAAIANEAHADYLISIHGNASSYEDVRGVETYYLRSLGEALTPDESDGPVSPEVKDPAEAARSFAADVQAALLTGLKEGKQTLRDRGVKPASFVVLRDAKMPAILAEISFMSSSKDAKQLDSSAYREKVTEALYSGIANHVTRAKSLSSMASLNQGTISGTP